MFFKDITFPIPVCYLLKLKSVKRKLKTMIFLSIYISTFQGYNVFTISNPSQSNKTRAKTKSFIIGAKYADRKSKMYRVTPLFLLTIFGWDVIFAPNISLYFVTLQRGSLCFVCWCWTLTALSHKSNILFFYLVKEYFWRQHAEEHRVSTKLNARKWLIFS